EEDKVIAVLKTYLPPALSTEELAAIVDDAVAKTGASSVKDMGKVMGMSKKAVQESGKDADNRELSELSKKRLS
ncbi:MAG: GatB/YqeY domain-containing protein, partial [Lentisphaeraceae bacterium]|nr:GatB/YqeY domain-containing protein [Lentisphaeraceae bacterium]